MSEAKFANGGALPQTVPSDGSAKVMLSPGYRLWPPSGSVSADPKYPGEGDYLPGWDDRKKLAEIWQQHHPLPDGLSEGAYEALIAIAKWGYDHRAAEEPETWEES